MSENKQVIPNWAKKLISEDIKYFDKIMRHFDRIEELNCRIHENIQRVEVFKLYNRKKEITTDIRNLQKENFRLAQLLNELKGIKN